MTDDVAWYLGIDWGRDEHHLCLLDADGQVCDEWRVAHTAPALHEASQRVRARTGGPAHAIAVGLETPHGVLVDTLLEQGFPRLRGQSETA